MPMLMTHLENSLNASDSCKGSASLSVCLHITKTWETMLLSLLCKDLALSSFGVSFKNAVVVLVVFLFTFFLRCVHRDWAEV